MGAFSGAVKLGDLNDFIAPSQACVVSLKGGKLAEGPQGLQEELDGQVQLQQRAAAQGFSQVKEAGPEGPIKVTLHDCLACSGCVTSAEAVLLEHQSAGELKQKLADPGTQVVVTISPQSRAALALYYGLTPAAAFARLCAFFKGLGAALVLDLATGRDAALLEAAAEFVARYRAAHPGDPALRPAPAPPPPGPVGEAQPGPLPLLASACPGWVCYAEKTHGRFILPHISTTKSPQAVMGSLVKRLLAQRLGIADPGRLFHCAIMPCYDKKLEASRDDFYVPGTRTPEVDSVLTSAEVAALLGEAGGDLGALPGCPPDSVLGGAPQQGAALYGLPGGSGGYADFVFRAAAAELFGVEVPPGPLPLRALRNADFQEVVLERGGRTLLRFGLAYGFRNIQTLVRKLKRGACQYDYVEVMACPSGCLNGGGQPPPAEGASPQQRLQQLDALYHHSEVVPRHPRDNPEVRALYGWDGSGGPGAGPAWDLLHTQYHRREKSVTSTLADW